MNKNVEFFSDPKKVAGLALTALIGIGLVILVIWLLKKYVFNKLQQNQVIRETSELVNKNELTYTDSDYRNMANTLFEAMNGPGTNEAKVYSVFKRLNTYSDLMQLITVFGYREGTWLFSGGPQTLSEWLQGEFNDLSEINKILAERGINYRF